MAGSLSPSGAALRRGDSTVSSNARLSPLPTTESERAAELRGNVSRAVMESNFGDLEELAHDIEAVNVYGIRNDHLTAWPSKLRTTLAMMRNTLDGVPNDPPRRRRSMARIRVTDPPADELSATRNTNQYDRNAGPAAPPITIAAYASGALHILLEALVQSVQADWGTVFVYSAKTEELVLACSVGKRMDRAGTLRLSAVSGIESHVLTTGIAVNVAHAYAEDEFRPAQDARSAHRTRSELVFPLLKPGSTAYSFGVMQLCNKAGGVDFFTDRDERSAAECAPLLAAIIAKYPNDVTNPICFDPTLLAGNVSAVRVDASSRTFALPQDVKDVGGTQLVFRTARAGHVRRSEVMRDAGGIATVPSISEALGHVAKVHDAWRNAVLLNIELEKEISRLQDSLSMGKREQQRLHGVIEELKRQLEVSGSTSEHRTTQRHSSTGLSQSM
jgi:putative methionine-R-sulfoxide reductase with GAF domain